MTNIDFTKTPVDEVFGTNCFSNAVMRERLPKETFKEILAVQAGEKELTLQTAEVVAQAMREWAVSKGASHYTHWFLPLTDLTAEKHDSFISPTGDGRVIMEFSGKELIKGEPDASSFPSGGLRATFEARGYTAWDVTSPAFLKQDPSGTTLCIPTAFISYTGQALDKKTPLLRTLDALNRQALRLLRACGHTSAKRVTAYVGPEQEYFLIDKKFFEQRPDLILTGRTVFGSGPAKGQELEDHYFGAIKERVAAFMRELNYELWKVGVPAKTQHNEVAPNQFEIAPVFQGTTAAVDGNQLMMETICTVARRHGMEALLHEKPFAGINGSGKHNNWSIGTIEADGSSVNLFDPGDDPSSNARFLLFAAAVIEAVDRYALLIRASTATAPNEHRLGANEAPPAIISIFFGQQLTDVFEAIARGETNGATGLPKKDKITLGVTSLPTLPKDISDRNRTSPFAFTGNKFEFRMCGSSQSIASPNMFINLTLAEVLGEYADALEELPRRAGKAERNAAIQSIVKEAYIKHSRVVFNGNGYSDEWVAEAEKRGLPNVKSAPEALEVLVTPETIALFEKHKVLTKEELESRYSIYLEKYSKQLNIETGISLEMTRRGIITAASKYLTEMSAAAVSMAQAGVAEYNAPQLKRVKAVAALISDVDKAADALDAVWDKAGEIEDELGQAKCYSNEVRPAMEQLRAKVDELEMMIPPKEWPFPGYEDILFKL